LIQEALIASEFVSAGLALVLVYFFVKAYRFKSSVHLLGLPIGFSFLASSFVFLGMSILYENDVALSESFLWLRLITQSFGLAFVAFTYHFSSKEEKTATYFLGTVSLASAASILLFLGVLVVTPPLVQLPPVNMVDEYFRIANLASLGYIIYYLFRHRASLYTSVSHLKGVSSAFSLLWLGQCSLFIWGIDGSDGAFIFAHVVRLASLILFISIYYLSTRGLK
jgi:hypothetical protein